MIGQGLTVSGTIKAWRVIFAMAALALPALLWSPGADAASVASRAIVKPQGGDPTYVYADLMDAGEISRRLQKSQTLRFVFAQGREILKKIPASEMSLMFSVSGDEAPAFQMALKLGGKEGGLLGRIASGKASADELGEFFGETWNSVTVEAAEDSSPLYRLSPLDSFFSSDGELLIFADSPEGVKKSIRASRNGSGRFSPARKSSGRNLILMTFGRDHSSAVADQISDLLAPQGETFPERLAFEMALALRPGGWEVDVFTDVIKSLYGPDFFAKNVRKPSGSFLRAGGGRLLASYDGTPPLLPLTASSYVRLISSLLDVEPLSYYDGIEKLTGPDAEDGISSGMAASDRLNVAITAAPDGEMSGYVAASESAGTNWRKEGEAFSRKVGVYDSLTAGGAGKYEEIRNAGWNHVYSAKADGSGADGKHGLTLAFDDSRALIGFFAPELLSEPFSAGTEFYEALTKAESALEIIYVDMKLLRKVLADRISKGSGGPSAMSLAPIAVLPFLDIWEAGALTLSPEHFRFSFRTGWLDFDDRDSALSIHGAYGLEF
ncbi:MAG: hypothetical protein LBF92_05805 [Synergistaceae bacterium]|jgi:hypothetical protein|nr:hypothetical protein [Synergistaceae bacterium]